MHARNGQGGQAMVLVAFALVALIGSAALVLLAGSFEWQRNQLQQLADQAALDSALKIGIGCSAGSASTVITEADNFVATQRARTGSLTIGAGSCATSYMGTDTFGGDLSEAIQYPYRLHQQQVEVTLTLTLPISFGGELGATNTTVVRRAVGQQLPGSVPAVSATTLSCTAGQVNVAGSIAAQNLITRGGTCAFYAHQRFDAASGTYSDLGNVSVYSDGQSWSAPGTCAALLNSGSSSAICADGYELSGHATPACGAAATSFLSAGDAAVNPNPCAASTAPQPVPPLSTALPPEPNTDAAAIATLPGNVACSAGAVYPNLVVAGTTVGTAEAGTPVPAKDAAGLYHFKPSCYGYLNVASATGGGISKVQVGPETPVVTHFVTPTLPAPSLVGTLLVADVKSQFTPNRFSAPAGWVNANGAAQLSGGRSEIWYYPNNPGGISSVTFTSNPANIDTLAQLSEWSGAAAASPLDQTGVVSVASNQLTATVSTSGAMSTANELVITADSFLSQPGQAIVQGAGYTSLANDPTNGYSGEYRLDLAAGVASETVTSSVATTWALTMATFKPSGTGGSAVLDPGFYYFNGSGVAGGGICLNGGSLFARDVTLEFVNQAGFSTGTCAVGGGSACVGTCQFGSTPCSISACPPNTPADVGAGGYTWFAAPCSQAPAGDASCPGSAWCPAGDRACWNLLTWSPSSNTGQIALTGAAEKAWLLGSIYWPGTCTDTVNGTSTIAGTLSCGTLIMAAAAGAGTAVGSDYGVNTALAEAILVE
jgi:hypothetical protein